MATKAQRVQAIADALINAPANVAMITRVADAFIINRMMDPVAFTQVQKAEFFLSTLREFVLSEVGLAEGNVAAQQARTAAKEDVNTDFKESP